MNSLERVMNTIQGKSVDRVPVFAVLSAYGARLAQLELPSIYQDAHCYLAAQKAALKAIPVDMAQAPFDYSVLAEAFGGKIKYFADQAPNLQRPAVRSWQELIKIPFPDFKSCGRLPVQLATIKLLAEEYAGEKPVFAGLPGPCALPVLTMGMDLWLNTLLFDPIGKKAVLEYCAEFLVAWAREMLAAGATGFIVTEAMAPAEITTREILTGLMPHICATLEKINCPKVIHHSGGRINHVLDLFADISGVIGYAVGPADDLLEARQIIGPHSLLVGNIDNLSFPRSDSEKIYRQSCDILEKMAGKGPFILANSGADIPVITPIDNIAAMLRASEDMATGKMRKG